MAKNCYFGQFHEFIAGEIKFFEIFLPIALYSTQFHEFIVGEIKFFEIFLPMASYSTHFHLSNPLLITAARFFFVERYISYKKIYVKENLHRHQYGRSIILKFVKTYIRLGCPKKYCKEISNTVVTHFDKFF